MTGGSDVWQLKVVSLDSFPPLLNQKLFDFFIQENHLRKFCKSSTRLLNNKSNLRYCCALHFFSNTSTSSSNVGALDSSLPGKNSTPSTPGSFSILHILRGIAVKCKYSFWDYTMFFFGGGLCSRMGFETLLCRGWCITPYV